MDGHPASKAYQQARKIIFIIGFLANIIIFLAFFLSGLSVALRDIAYGFSQNFFIVNAIYMCALSLGLLLVHFPLDFLGEFILEHRFQLSNQKFHEWLWDLTKRFFLQLMLTLLIVEVGYILLDRFPRTWWVWAGAFWLFLTLILAKITPNVLIPIFYKYSKIGNEELRARILGLFEKAKIPVQNAYMVDFSKKTKKANAFICGLGKGRRVVLSDTLVSDFSIPEIEAVVAHEIGHYKHHDILKLTIFHTLTTLLGFFIMNRLWEVFAAHSPAIHIADIAFFPVLAVAFSMFSFLMMPLSNSFSRYLEVKADLFSLKATLAPQHFISMMKKLGVKNLSEFNPGLLTEIFLYDHPPISKRIDLAQNYQLSL
ncbi:MAG: M48 family metallopeptidase [Candidatus Omnitrophota bacterium]